MIANRVNQIVRYVCESERELPESDRTTWLLKVLSREDCAIIQDSLVGYDPDSGVVVSRPGTGQLKACELGIDDFENFRDADGTEVRARYRKRSKGRRSLMDTTLDQIPPDAIAELAGKIMTINGLAGREDEQQDRNREGADARPTSPTATGSDTPPPSSPIT